MLKIEKITEIICPSLYLIACSLPELFSVSDRAGNMGRRVGLSAIKRMTGLDIFYPGQQHRWLGKAMFLKHVIPTRF